MRHLVIAGLVCGCAVSIHAAFGQDDIKGEWRTALTGKKFVRAVSWYGPDGKATKFVVTGIAFEDNARHIAITVAEQTTGTPTVLKTWSGFCVPFPGISGSDRVNIVCRLQTFQQADYRNDRLDKDAELEIKTSGERPPKRITSLDIRVTSKTVGEPDRFHPDLPAGTFLRFYEESFFDKGKIEVRGK